MTVMNLYSMLCIAQEITIQMMKKQHRAEDCYYLLDTKHMFGIIER